MEDGFRVRIEDRKAAQAAVDAEIERLRGNRETKRRAESYNHPDAAKNMKRRT